MRRPLAVIVVALAALVAHPLVRSAFRLPVKPPRPAQDRL